MSIWCLLSSKFKFQKKCLFVITLHEWTWLCSTINRGQFQRILHHIFWFFTPILLPLFLIKILIITLPKSTLNWTRPFVVWFSITMSTRSSVLFRVIGLCNQFSEKKCDCSLENQSNVIRCDCSLGKSIGWTCCT